MFETRLSSRVLVSAAPGFSSSSLSCSCTQKGTRTSEGPRLKPTLYEFNTIRWMSFLQKRLSPVKAVIRSMCEGEDGRVH